jgi:4-hydroxythreonine-4-phosphate dehydrogenase
VPALVTQERVGIVIRSLVEALRRLGVSKPRIAVAGLNPHSGEGGLFGTEDIEVIAPSVNAAVADGLDVAGPIAGDTVFVKLRAGQYDGVVAMYHDQGHIPVKLLGFEVDPVSGRWSSVEGVNVTLGLPIIRTSVDHGTAFDIAGQGIANEGSLIEAALVAARMAGTEGS